ncbi:MAG: aspartate/glutamate racemase family protein [Phenylobacterium sp.]|nr:aspartate/glutamate racemase family protein [Phenylobacterium sp.]
MTQTRYASAGRIGIGTPQANPTVEDEFGIMPPRGMSSNVVRLTSAAEDPLERLRRYIEDLGDTLGDFDVLKPDVFGFACTGSTYLVGHEREREIVAACEARRGYPVVTAAEAILWALERLNARRIVVIAPYPAALVAAGQTYFEGRGLTVLAKHRIETATADTRGIYDLAWGQASEALASLDVKGADAILLSGTGMPSLPVVAAGHPSGVPVISSNFCLAAKMMSRMGREDLLDEGLGVAGWRDRLAETLR